VKRILKGLIRKVLSFVFRCFNAVGRAFRLTGLLEVVRQARWSAKLAAIGEATIIHASVIIHSPTRVRIGARCSIAEFVHIWGDGGVSIGNDVLIASHVVITSLTHDTSAARYRDSTVQGPIEIGDNVWIGAGAIILPGVTLGAGSVIGAGAVVTKDTPIRAVVAGVPARVIRQLS